MPPAPADPTGGADLLGPAHALRELGAMLLEDVQPLGPAGLVGDLLTIQAVATHLEDLVHELLDRLPDWTADSPEMTRLRHDVRTPLNQIIGYCDLWLEGGDEDAPAAERFRPQLEQLRAVGLGLMTQLNAFKSGRSAEGTRDTRHETRDELPSLESRVSSLMSDSPPGRILVVDDNPFNREVLVRRLQRQGHEVDEAVNGRQALEKLTAERFDLVLLDIVMPELNGLDVLAGLKADDRLRHLPVIMISALDDIGRIAHCLHSGADDYLPRPYNATILRARVDALLERKRLRDREVEHLAQIEAEKEHVNELLHVILPAEAVKELQTSGEVRPRRYEGVAILFADVVGFTPYCDSAPPETVVADLQHLVARFEQEADAVGIQKIKTIGDAFMAAGNLLRPSGDPVMASVRCGAAMIAAAREVPPYWQMRVGVHIGPVMAGVVGTRQYLFDVWGDTVNTAARVQSVAEPGTVTLSRAAWDEVAAHCRGTSRGEVIIKGKGPMELVRWDAFAR
jgi:class 3 adenylate cyclase